MRWEECALSFALFVGVGWHGTTAIFVITPTGIVAGTDQLTKGSSSSGKAVFRKDITKIQLINGKFIVASVGIERSNAYSFEDWITKVGNKLAPDASVTQFVGLIENEATKTFKDDMAIEKYMRSGALVKSQPFEDTLVEYIVAGYESGVPTIIRTYFNLDWHDKRLVGPVRDVDFPAGGSNPTIGIKMKGVDGGLGELPSIHRYDYKRLLYDSRPILCKFPSRSNM